MTPRHGPIAAQRERNARIREHAERIARSIELADGDSAIPVAVVPANSRETEALPADSRAIFLERLQGTIAQVFASRPVDASAQQPGASSATLPDVDSAGRISGQYDSTLPPGAPAIDMNDILGRSCGTCRGECCTAGGTHAFLRHDSITRVSRDNADLDADSLLALYASHLPARHYRGSCVYHTTTGCTLPRELRSNLCNRYICGGLTQLTNALAASGGSQIYVGAADSVHLRRMALVGLNSTIPISLTAKQSSANTSAARIAMAHQTRGRSAGGTLDE